MRETEILYTGKLPSMHKHPWICARLCDNIIRYDKDRAPQCPYPKSKINFEQ